MSGRIIAAAAIALGAFACAERVDPPALISLSWEELEPMVEAFGYEQGIDNFCGGTLTGLDDFMTEIGEAPGLESLLDQANARADEVRQEFADADPEEDPEYICTVEMFAGSEDRAAVQRAIWQDKKSSVE